MDWIALQNRLPRDADLTARTHRLLALEAVLDGRQYDHLPYPFSCERSPAGEYVPLSERRPSVRTGLCRVVVEDAVSLLFSEGHFPAVQCDDPVTRAALPMLVKDARLNETMLEAATRGSVGSVAVLFRVFEGRPFFDVLPSAFLWPEWADGDRRRLRRVVERYKASGRELAAQGYAVDPARRYWFTRAWDDVAETWFEPIGVDEPGTPRVDAGRSVRHDLGFVPICWIRNLPGRTGEEPDGSSTFGAAIDTVIETDYLLSQAGRGLKYGSDPTLVLKDSGFAGGGPAHVGGAATALVLPPEGDAKLLEINGNAAGAVLAHVKELRAIALEAMHGNRAHGDRVGAPQSGRAMELLAQGLIWLADRLRISYGEGALLELLRMVCAASARLPDGVQIGGQRYRDLSAEGLGLRWPDWFAPNAAERQAQASTLATLVDAGILSRETATASVAATYDVDNLGAELARIADAGARAASQNEGEDGDE